MKLPETARGRERLVAWVLVGIVVALLALAMILDARELWPLPVIAVGLFVFMKGVLVVSDWVLRGRD